jgi:tRNA pseudouridine55 synthase
MTNNVKLPSEYEGVLPIWKPAGMTSHDVVARVRRILRMKRVGHTGTLDPMVTGVLPICLGRTTRIVEYIQDLPKQYRAEVTIGYSTDTEDASGEVISRADNVQLLESDIRLALEDFVGEIEQVPPMYSAVKSEGKRLYELARQGLEVERKPRKVTIYSINVESVDLSLAYPKIRFSVWCSKGTYIRTLCSDLGRRLGYPAVMSDLVRASTGSFTEESCITLEALAEAAEAGKAADLLIQAYDALPHLPAFLLEDKTVPMALNGRKLELSSLSPRPQESISAARVYSNVEEHRFIGIYRIDLSSGLAVPEKLFT